MLKLPNDNTSLEIAKTVAGIDVMDDENEKAAQRQVQDQAGGQVEKVGGVGFKVPNDDGEAREQGVSEERGDGTDG